MKTTGDPSIAALERLRPVLGPIFAAYGISPESSGEIVKECCRRLVSKWPAIPDPDHWLLRAIIERCQTLQEERTFEDPSQ
jgi:hypothetical protein